MCSDIWGMAAESRIGCVNLGGDNASKEEALRKRQQTRASYPSSEAFEAGDSQEVARLFIFRAALGVQCCWMCASSDAVHVGYCRVEDEDAITARIVGGCFNVKFST